MATPFVEELVDYLVTQSIGTKATDLFFDFFPDTSTSPMACLVDTGGPQAPTNIPHRQASVQVMVRADDYDDARLFAAQIYNILHGMLGVALTNSQVMASRAYGLPQSIGQDKNGRHEVSANYEFDTYATTASGETSSGFGGDKDPNLN